MALDAATLALCARELKTTLLDSRIDKIFEPTRDEVLLLLRTRTDTYRMLLSARSGSARVCLTGESFENPATPPGFCMLLRKHLAGGRLLDIRMEPGERIVFFDFQCVNEMGDLVKNTLAAELMGRYSNLVLVQDGRILDALKRVDFEDSAIRQLLPGLPYTMPPRPARPDFFSVSSAALVALAMQKDLPVADALMKSCGGVGPVVCREAAFRALGDSHRPANELTAAEQSALAAALDAIRDDHAAGGVPTAAAAPDGRPVEFSFTALTQYGPDACRTYPDFSALLEDYYAVKDRAERLRQKSRDLIKTVRNLHERAVRKQAARTEELAQSEASDELRIKGELVQANLWQIERGMASVTVDNYYTGQKETIPLDVRLSPSGNAQKYFKEYKKKQTAAKMLARLLEEGAREIEYLETVVYEVETASGEQALGEIRAELKSQGYLKYYKARDKKQKPADFFRYRSTDGFLILVGRNNAQNDKLTLHTARGRDLWFHVKNAPGSHTVVISEGQPIPDSTREEAAQLAVLHSSQAGGAKVPVDYTFVRNIRKTGDLKPGMVLYDTYETAYITPDPALREKLRV
ncbi:NFACT family protein [Gemmiger formicilis]|uniref:Rqc2 family fibronectin-binding protein n=1 Tax=Gemmiger formicilis TaxID=745368 RepID=UPI00195836D1|nr:NFACT RNA binding domain-containing protein [Gemmiger formicilis]MBM6915182.1 NFACT family protein [Gemmiger formicilis]